MISVCVGVSHDGRSQRALQSNFGPFPTTGFLVGRIPHLRSMSVSDSTRFAAQDLGTHEKLPTQVQGSAAADLARGTGFTFGQRK